MGKKAADPVVSESPSPLTIGRLAKAAGVGVETVRYYQCRRLLRVPANGDSARVYPRAAVDRITFIKRAQALGFTLDDVRSLLDLEDGHNRRAMQSVVEVRLRQIEDKLSDLERMREVLSRLLQRCRETGTHEACPIVAAIAGSAPT